MSVWGPLCQYFVPGPGSALGGPETIPTAEKNLLGKFFIGILPVAMVLMTRLPEICCISSPLTSLKPKTTFLYVYNALPMLSCEHDNWNSFD
ncbi:hypothetical protein AVEN_262106-1 [Araneus ventricosus]|uniref:Uncharacterized protein n=1 Tax=Araneus ventricosus TaxID=182803 RepID=A0A4Y2J8P1_ARAVE|nr:hypothetical protein AVEN_262106-1 [Araneus ventricosus]